LRIRIEFAALFSKIKPNVNVKEGKSSYFSSKATMFEKRAYIKEEALGEKFECSYI
jgi:hypothetical protein